MSPLTYVILATIIVLGWRLFLRGWRGVAIDDHPVCAKCKFDLTGRPPESYKCPECGAFVSKYSIEIGNRRRRDGLMYAGLAIALLGAFPLFAGIGTSVMGVDPVRVEPLWWLVREGVANSSSLQPNKYAAEILDRVKRNKISASDATTVANVALRLQADSTKPWQPVWGEIMEAMQSRGRVSSADWQKYQSQDEPATLEVRSCVARGDPIAFHMHGQLRGSTAFLLSPTGVYGRIPGRPNEIAAWGANVTNGEFDTTGWVSLSAGSWAGLQAGPQSIFITVVGLGTTAAHPTGTSNTKQGSWMLLNDGEPTVKLYRDEALAAVVEKTLSCTVKVQDAIQMRLAGRPSIWVMIRLERAPVDLAFNVFLRSGSKEYNEDGYGFVASAKQNVLSDVCVFQEASELVGHRVDIILRPSVAGAARTVHMDKLLDHEFVFKDVLIESPK